MSKKTILMLPTWYPTKENPFNGCFFREQALAMQKDFNFVVAVYHEKAELFLLFQLKKLFGLEKPKVNFIQNDCGLQEYAIYVKKPQHVVWDLFIERFRKVFCHRTLRQGIGYEEPKSLKKNRYFIAEFIKKHNFLPHVDCVYSLTAQDYAPLGKAFADTFRVPHVTAEHAPFPWPGHTLRDSTVEAIESADAFLAISNDKIRQVLLQNVKVNPIWVGNLCDETKFCISTEKHDVPTFLIVAANSFYKNYSLFIKSMEELKRIAVKDFKIKIVGYNSNKGYSLDAKELEETVHNSIISENTTMIEAVSREDMPALYNSCDVFVMTSIQEGLPVSALEASMSGLPVISTRCGGVEDYVDDTMGRIFAITDYKGIANACNDYLNGKITFDSKYIRKRAVELFGNDVFTTRMKNVFEGVIKNGKNS